MPRAMQPLLVTDIVGSTQLWAEHESSMAHDRHEIDTELGPDELAAIEAAAARLDLDSAAVIALDALDRIIAGG